MFKSISSIGLLNVIIKALFTLRLGDVKIMYLVLLGYYLFISLLAALPCRRPVDSTRSADGGKRQAYTIEA